MLQIVCDAEVLIGVDEVEEVVGNAALVCGGGFCGADIHLAVDRHGVECEDFGVEGFGEEQREGGLSGGGWSGEEAGLLEQVEGKGHVFEFRG